MHEHLVSLGSSVQALREQIASGIVLAPNAALPQAASAQAASPVEATCATVAAPVTACAPATTLAPAMATAPATVATVTAKEKGMQPFPSLGQLKHMDKVR